MSKNTVRSALTPKPRTKRTRRPVETIEFDAFVRRILRAYARRVAAGDVEALRSLSVLSTEVDAVCRLAVAGLRTSPCSYSWSQIADLRQSGYTGWIDQDGYPAGHFITDWGLPRVAPLNAAAEVAPEATPGAGQASGTVARVLRSAAVYLERHGWIQGAYYDGTSEVFTPAACLVGAIGMVCYGGPVDAPAQHFDDPGYLDFEEAVLHLDRYLLVEDGSESYEFNDAKGRRVADIIHVLRQAADTPAEELIDALRAIDAKSAEMAAVVQLLKPCGMWGDPTASASSAGGDGQ